MLTDVKEPINIDLSVTNKQKFRINGDNDQILELNVADMGIIGRLGETIPKLKQLAEKASSLEADEIVAESENETDSAAIRKLGNTIKELDRQMRDAIDYVFDSNVSEVCAPNGTMYDIFDGQFRYEYIIDKLTDLYTDNIQLEANRIKSRAENHTNKYTSKSKKKK